MKGVAGYAAQFYLRYGASLGPLRRVPWLGGWARWAAARLVSFDARVWAQVQRGPAQGLWLKLNPRTGQEYFRGAVEPGVQRVLAKHLRPGMVFYDIGANIGFFSLLGARLVGPTGRVFAFEPEPALLPRLRENIERNGLTQITTIGKAVAAVSGETPFEPADPRRSPDFGQGRVRENAGSTTLEIPAVSLNDFVMDHPWPDVVKCDVEGAEVDVLRGATRLLSTHRTIFVIEVHSAGHERAARELLELHGYTVTRLDELHLFARG